eukprot:CAMPEP_0195071658 /NCGR_PEP_ID=MMETSP0448-20130528/15403_1 /TAXON_ID=66468 /ORGANISM="Heterocapsa triquestra, Strain CCMP 448" /LENGTH=557 /DNA_ID=CAMNT_0040103541 /DNA_START=7 /DNA_END=1680 /DNA_ORIENTATION=+
MAASAELPMTVRDNSCMDTATTEEDSSSPLARGSVAGKNEEAENARWQVIGRVFLAGCWVAFLIAASIINLERATGALVATALFAAFFLWAYTKHLVLPHVQEGVVKPALEWMNAHPSTVASSKIALAATCGGLWVYYDIIPQPQRLIPMAGLVILVGLTYITSKHRRAICWRPVYSGILLQILLAVFILRTHVGHRIFMVAGDAVSALLDHVEAGCSFVFGDDYMQHNIAMRVLPTIIFFSSLVSVGYFMGWLQHLFVYLARCVHHIMGTSAIESVVAASNIFIGQTEAGVLIGPFLKDLTMSELHAVCTCGMATIAGSVMATYIEFGAPANHLLAASVMSCPAALAMSKLSYPETEEIRVQVKSADDVTACLELTSDRNIIDAAASGACAAIALVANIAANLIAFLSIWSLLDGILAHGGEMLDIEGLTFEYAFGYVLWPVAFILGVPAQDCSAVAQLLGVKTVLNEFVAYKKLSELIADRAISAQAEVIATYAICGFSNIGSMGIQLGCLGALAPTRKQDLAGVLVRSLFASTVACFMTACIAGMLWQEMDGEP